MEYRRRAANSAADYLSRIQPKNGDNPTFQEEGELSLAITTTIYSAEDLEEHCRDIMSCLQGKTPVWLDDRRRSHMKANAKNFLVWESMLFRPTIHDLRVVVPLPDREKVLKGFHDDIGHWGLNTSSQFVTERYWWPTFCTDVRDYVKSCDGCQMARPIPMGGRKVVLASTGPLCALPFQACLIFSLLSLPAPSLLAHPGTASC